MWVHNTGSRCVGEEIAAKMVVENHISRFFSFLFFYLFEFSGATQTGD